MTHPNSAKLENLRAGMFACLIAMTAPVAFAKGQFVYNGKEYPSAAAACTQLLKDLDPPQAYKSSEPPDEFGNVHCVGQLSDGSPGFDMYQNGIQYVRNADETISENKENGGADQRGSADADDSKEGAAPKSNDARPPQPLADSSEPTQPQDQKKELPCKYEFRRSQAPLGDDPLSNLLCESVSGGSPSFIVYPETSDGKVGKMITEIDALRGNTWYECKCGYASTVKGMKKGERLARLRVEGEQGLDKKLRVQSQVAQDCGLSLEVHIANKEVADFFRERYTFLKVVDANFEPCE